MNKKFERKFTGLILDIQMDLLVKVSKDYDLDLNELKTKYLEETNKKSSTNKRPKKLSGYNLFLGSEEVSNMAKERSEDGDFGSLAKIKGNMWSSLSQAEKSKWNKKADAINKSNQKSIEESFTIKIN